MTSAWPTVGEGTSPVGVITQRKSKKTKTPHVGMADGGDSTKTNSKGAKKDSTARATKRRNERTIGGRDGGERAGEGAENLGNEANKQRSGAKKDNAAKAGKQQTGQAIGERGRGQGAGWRGGGRGGMSHGGIEKLRVNIRGGGGLQEVQGCRDPTAASVAKPAETGCSDLMIKAREEQQARQDPGDSVNGEVHSREGQQEGTGELMSAASGKSYDPMHSESNPISMQQEDWRPYTEDSRDPRPSCTSKREGDTGKKEARHHEDDARETAARRTGMMEGLSNESLQNEGRTKTDTVDQEAGHGTGRGSQPRRPHMANSGGWASPPTSWVVHEDPEDAARPNKIARGFHIYGDGTGWGPPPPRLGWGEGTLPGAPSGWGSWDTERGAVLPRADQDVARVDPGRGWGRGSAGRGWGDDIPLGENTWGSRDAERGTMPKKLKEEDEEESQRACELINDLIEDEEKENQDEGAQWAEDQGFTIRDANGKFVGCFSAWNNGEQCGEWPAAKCKRHEQGVGAIGGGSASGVTEDKTPGLVHKGDREGSIAMKGATQSRDITRQLAEDAREKEANQGEDGVTVTTAGERFGVEGVNDESLRTEGGTDEILFREGGFKPD